MELKQLSEVEDYDIVRDILLRVQRMPDRSNESILIVEREIRHIHGGTNPYIAKDIKRRPHERQRIKKKLHRHNIGEIAKKEGLSRSTLYRMLKEKKAEQSDRNKR